MTRTTSGTEHSEGRQGFLGDEHRVRTAREALLWADLEHPNVARVVVREPGVDCVRCTTALVNARSLTDVLAEQRTLGIDRAAHIVEQLLAALGAAHRVGLVHGGVCAERVLITERDGDPDFVLVTGFASPEPPRFPPPEGAPGGVLGDLYAAGCVGYQIISGAPPASGQLNPRDAAPGVRVPFGLGEWVARLMAASPADRFQSADAARNALTRIYASRSMIRYGAKPIRDAVDAVVRIDGPIAPPRAKPRRLWLAVAVACGLVGLIVGLVLWLA